MKIKDGESVEIYLDSDNIILKKQYSYKKNKKKNKKKIKKINNKIKNLKSKADKL